LHSQASEQAGEHFYIMVKLDSDSVIKLEIAREIPVKKGDMVLLNERTTNFFGFKSYSFQQIAN
jgi:hypothetical protein